MNAWLWNDSAFDSLTSLPVTDRGFRYGMALFETVRLFRGRPLFLAEHAEKLRAASAERAFPPCEPALAALAPLLAQQPDGVARIYITAGDGAGFADDVSAPRIIVLSEARPDPDPAPCRLMLAPGVYHAPFGGLKTANYWLNIDALQQALRSGHDESLLFNENAELVSAATANIFIVRDGVVSTPSAACGARQGVTRAWAMQQLAPRECSLFVQDLRTADELFLTSSWFGIRPVASLEGRTLPSRSIGVQLMSDFEQEIATP